MSVLKSFLNYYISWMCVKLKALRTTCRLAVTEGKLREHVVAEDMCGFLCSRSTQRRKWLFLLFFLLSHCVYLINHEQDIFRKVIGIYLWFGIYKSILIPTLSNNLIPYIDTIGTVGSVLLFQPGFEFRGKLSFI